MTPSTYTYQITFELDNYLRDNSYFESEERTMVNQKILSDWNAKYKSAITADIKSKYDNVEVDFLSSEFDLESEDDRGACVFFHKVVIRDEVNLESISAFIKTLVNYNKTTIYLDSSYATVNKWSGISKVLKIAFAKLKTSDKNSGFFNPICLADLVK